MKKARLLLALSQTLLSPLEEYSRNNSTKSNSTKSATSTIIKKERKRRTKLAKVIKNKR